MGEESIPRLLLEFGIPATIGIVVNALYNTINAIFIGRSVGEIGLAATTAAFPSVIVMMAFGMLVGAGGNALVAIKLGEGSRENAERILGNMVTLLAIVSAVVAIGGLAFMEPILRISGASDEVVPVATQYMSILFGGLIFQGIAFGLNAVIRTAGNPRRAMGTMLIGAALNVVLDYVFIVSWGWGVRGAAIATIISQAVSAALVLHFFLSAKSPLKLRWRNLALDAPLARGVLSLGAASFLMQIAGAVVNVVLNQSVGTLGAATALGTAGSLAVVGVFSRIGQLFVMPVMGVVMAAQPIIGYNYGARNFNRVRETFLVASLGATALLAALWAILMLFPTQLVALFGLTDAAVADFAALALRTDLVLLPLIGFQMMGATYFQSTGQPGRSTLLSLSRQVIFLIPAILLLPVAITHFGGDPMSSLLGTVWAFPLADLLSTTLTAIFVVRELSHLDAAHAREVEFRDRNGDGQIDVHDFEEPVLLGHTEA